MPSIEETYTAPPAIAGRRGDLALLAPRPGQLAVVGVEGVDPPRVGPEHRQAVPHRRRELDQRAALERPRGLAARGRHPHAGDVSLAGRVAAVLGALQARVVEARPPPPPCAPARAPARRAPPHGHRGGAERDLGAPLGVGLRAGDDHRAAPHRLDRRARDGRLGVTVDHAHLDGRAIGRGGGGRGGGARRGPSSRPRRRPRRRSPAAGAPPRAPPSRRARRGSTPEPHAPRGSLATRRPR